jgi:hypothetical protein
MSIVKKLGEGYRFTERDFNLGWELMVKLDSTDEEEEFSYLALLAEEMNAHSKPFPTLGETIAEHWKREDAHWQKQFKCNAPRPGEWVEPDWKALLEKSAENERNAKK